MLKLHKNWVWLAAAMLPAGVAAAATRQCAPGSPTKASYTWNFQKEASNTFNDLSMEAAHTVNLASVLQSYQRSHQISYWSQAFKLEQIRENINTMGAQLCRLEKIQRVLPRFDQREIKTVRPTLTFMANHTTYASRYAGDHQDELWVPAYAGWVQGIYTESQQLSHTLNQYKEYAKLHNEDLRLEHTLGSGTGK